MILTVINKKGGVGKTSLAFSLAKDFDYKLTSNDDSVITSIYNKAQITLKPILENNCVYDFGGFVDPKALNIVKESDFVLVPTINELNILRSTINTLKELVLIQKNIIIVVMKTNKGRKDYEEVEKQISTYFKDLSFFELKESRIFKNTLEHGLSLKELYEEDKLSKYLYKSIFTQYDELLKHLKNTTK